MVIHCCLSSSTFSNDFSSKTAGLILTRFHQEAQLFWGTENFFWRFGSHDKNSCYSICSKNHLKIISSRTKKLGLLKLDMNYWGPLSNKGDSNNFPEVDMQPFHGKVKFVSPYIIYENYTVIWRICMKVFCWKKVTECDQRNKTFLLESKSYTQRIILSYPDAVYMHKIMKMVLTYPFDHFAEFEHISYSASWGFGYKR